MIYFGHNGEGLRSFAISINEYENKRWVLLWEVIIILTKEILVKDMIWRKGAKHA